MSSNRVAGLRGLTTNVEIQGISRRWRIPQPKKDLCTCSRVLLVHEAHQEYFDARMHVISLRSTRRGASRWQASAAAF
jgi:hypothetical protein